MYTDYRRDLGVDGDRFTRDKIGLVACIIDDLYADIVSAVCKCLRGEPCNGVVLYNKVRIICCPCIRSAGACEDIALITDMYTHLYRIAVNAA